MHNCLSEIEGSKFKGYQVGSQSCDQEKYDECHESLDVHFPQRQPDNKIDFIILTYP